MAASRHAHNFRKCSHTSVELTQARHHLLASLYSSPWCLHIVGANRCLCFIYIQQSTRATVLKKNGRNYLLCKCNMHCFVQFPDGLST